MEEVQINKRLEVTERQIGLLEQCIADAKEHEGEFSPVIYSAMIAGYESLRKDLRTEAAGYRTALS